MFSIYILVLYTLLVAIKPTRKAAVALTPWLVFACSYDWMRLLPNYEVNSIDVRGLYETEKQLFGIAAGQSTLIPSEYFALHHSTLADVLAGFFYLCWVPVPLGFALYLYFKGQHRSYLRFSLAFLFVNLLGFCGYYIHPAAPPWYAMNYGFEPILHTPGNVAGLGRFDQLTGIPVFHALYGANANVFAAVPSLHAAYMLIATVYAALSHRRNALVCVFATICAGIWWTAVYSGHHYIIDVLLGIATALVGIVLLERFILRIPVVKRGFERYVGYISR
ncbi:MAG TPA: phosphatase PAP2 family protein [Prevotella sp.]